MPKKRTNRRARGTGSIFFHEARQRWVGRKVVDGVRVERWGLTQSEVVRKLDKVGPADKDSTTVARWAANWRETWTMRPSTRHGYGLNLDQHILPALGFLRMSAVSTAHVERMIAKLGATHAPGTVGNVIAVARAMFAAAVRADVIDKNPVANARKPRSIQSEMQVFTPEQLATIIRVSADYASGGVVAALAAVGARIGEVLALDVADWNPAKQTLSITKTYSLRFGTGPTKSRHSRRVIAVPNVLVPILNAAAGNRSVGPLFPTLTGARRPAQTVAKAWKSITRDADVPRTKPHMMRHSVATAMIAAGVPIPDAAAYLGDTTATVVKFYVHRTGFDPAETLNRLYGGQKVGNRPATAKNERDSRTIAVVA